MVPETHMFNSLRAENGYTVLSDSLDTDSYAMKAFLQEATPVDPHPLMQPHMLAQHASNKLHALMIG